ncbi:MAG: hypothetical protein KJN80_01945, partial [Deltaproteobacteria bacterium]|nr:hypothetical protein [Deltaproteobacteria bacterium]
MKILLIYPYFLEDRIHADDIADVPQGLFYVGAVLRENNFEVEILNWYNINKTPDKINQTLIEKAFLICCVLIFLLSEFLIVSLPLSTP